MTARFFASVSRTAFLLTVSAVPALAHGWVLPPVIFTPAGGATQEQIEATARQAVQEGGYLGPAGGVTEIPTAGTTEQTTAPSAPAAPVLRPRSGATLPAVVRSGPASRPKGTRAPWMDRVHVPWKAAFTPVSGNDGYDAAIGSIDQGLRLSPDMGGWTREESPSIVVISDASNEKHVAALKALDGDSRFVAAAHLFNCFRVDSRTMDKASSEVVLRVYRTDGTLVGDTKGRLHRGFELLEKAWSLDRGAELAKAVPKVQELVSGRAFSEHCLSEIENAVVCPDCGHERHDVVEKIADFQIRRDLYAAAIEKARAK